MIESRRISRKYLWGHLLLEERDWDTGSETKSGWNEMEEIEKAYENKLTIRDTNEPINDLNRDEDEIFLLNCE